MDINQQGVAVQRFDIVKAMNRNDRLLRDVFSLLAREERRGQDIFYKAKKNEFTQVLKTMKIVDNLSDANSKVDRMWERLLEIVLFFRTKKHRKPVEILKSFISKRDSGPGNGRPRFTRSEERRLRGIFAFLRSAYRTSELSKTRLATDQTHFYIMITSLIGGDLLNNFSHSDLVKRLVKFGKILDGAARLPRDRKLSNTIRHYQELSEKQTTDVSSREERQKNFIEVISSL